MSINKRIGTICNVHIMEYSILVKQITVIESMIMIS